MFVFARKTFSASRVPQSFVDQTVGSSPCTFLTLEEVTYAVSHTIEVSTCLHLPHSASCKSKPDTLTRSKVSTTSTTHFPSPLQLPPSIDFSWSFLDHHDQRVTFAPYLRLSSADRSIPLPAVLSSTEHAPHTWSPHHHTMPLS